MKKKTLTAKQAAFVEARSFGNGQERSAILAGVNPDNAARMDKVPAVKEELARIRELARAASGVTREQVIEMFREAADMARALGDPQGLTAAAREIGKICGLYAPEVKKITHDMDASTLRKALKDMSEDELYRIAHGRTIEGSARVLSMSPDQEPARLPYEAERDVQSVRGRPEAEADGGTGGGAAPAEEDAPEGDQEAGREEGPEVGESEPGEEGGSPDAGDPTGSAGSGSGDAGTGPTGTSPA